MTREMHWKVYLEKQRVWTIILVRNTFEYQKNTWFNIQHYTVPAGYDYGFIVFVLSLYYSCNSWSVTIIIIISYKVHIRAID